MRSVPAAAPELVKWAALRRGHHPSRFRCDQGRIGERRDQVRLHPLCLRQWRRHTQKRLPREDHRPLRHRPDVSLEPKVRECVQDRRIDLLKSWPLPDRLDLLGRKGHPNQVADCLLETGKNHEGSVRRHLPNEELEGRTSIRHPGGEVPNDHRQFVKIGNRSKGIGIGPERDRWLGLHGLSSGVFGPGAGGEPTGPLPRSSQPTDRCRVTWADSASSEPRGSRSNAPSGQRVARSLRTVDAPSPCRVRPMPPDRPV